MSKKIGRNKPCPCGSGKKYKKCCLGKVPIENPRGRNRTVAGTGISPVDHQGSPFRREMRPTGKGGRAPAALSIPTAPAVIPNPGPGSGIDKGNEEILELHYDPDEIGQMTGHIHSRMMKESKYVDRGNFIGICTMDLHLMFGMYDRFFFHGYFKREHPGKVKFRLSKRMTSAGAKTFTYRNPESYVISLSTHLLYQTFGDEEREIVVNGITCIDRLEAAQRLFEHELIHVLEQMLFGESSCSKSRFGALAKRIFGHTDVTHQLETGYEIAKEKHGLKVGDRVFFEYEGEGFEGTISRITKRATVMVRDPEGEYQDWDGNEYCKYYIPLGCLERLG